MDTRHTSQGLRQFPVIYGTIWALIWAICANMIVFLWSNYGNATAGQLTVAAYVIHCTAVLFGGFRAARCASEKGWYYGGLTGLMYAIFMILIGLTVYNTFSMDAGGGFRTVLMILIGAFAGIIGVNSGAR